MEQGFSEKLHEAGIDEGDATAVATYLRQIPNVNTALLGKYLMSNEVLLKAYVATFNVENLSYISALRSFMETVRPMPPKIKVIDRFVNAWNEHYYTHSHHPDRALLGSLEAMFSLTYSVIMLNVDRHSAELSDRSKLQLDRYVYNLRGLNTFFQGKESADFDTDLLTRIYLDVVQNEIKARK